MRFAKIVNARPEELPEDMLVVFHRIPCVDKVFVLAAVDNAVGIQLVVGVVTVLGVVVSRNVERAGVFGGVRHHNARQSCRNRTRKVVFLHCGGQAFGYVAQAFRLGCVLFVSSVHRLRKVSLTHAVEYGVGVRVVGIVHLVAYAPGKD